MPKIIAICATAMMPINSRKCAYIVPFPVGDIGTKNNGGGCWPGYLPSEVQGTNVIIKSSDLEGGSYYFA